MIDSISISGFINITVLLINFGFFSVNFPPIITDI